jgi:3-oxo-5-alpha-steroid 4-dehydrogenase 1
MSNWLSPLVNTWHTGDASFDICLKIELILVASSALGVHLQAPYGKLANSSLSSISLPSRLGWWLMELPATVSFLVTWICTPPSDQLSPAISWLLFALWCRHYGNRGWFFPLSIRVAAGSSTSFNIFVSLIGALFTALHGFLNAKLFRALGSHYTAAWLTDPRFLIGLGVYETGFWVTVHSEHMMRQLRPQDGTAPRDAQRYRIPRGGLFEYVTNAHYLGELTAWFGFACLTCSLPGIAVFVISLLNLVPRAFQNHAWYMSKFEEYGSLRRQVLVPFVL